MNKKMLLKKNIPDTPGVYYFLGRPSGGGKKGVDILYVGKATSLKNRVRSYFQGDIKEKRSKIIEKMVGEATDIKWTETDSVLEALILEANEIKRHQPVYNSKEKDNKSFNYVLITREIFPRILVVRGREVLQKKTALKDIQIQHEFGPFPSGTALKEALRIIRKIFPFRDVKSTQKEHQRFYKQLGLLPDTSDSRAATKYKKSIQHIVLFFKGKKKQLLSTLKKQMLAEAKEEHFEEAQRIKGQIFALEHIRDVSLIDDGFVKDSRHIQEYRIEAYDVAHTSGKNVVGVMTVVESGEIKKSDYRKFIIKDSPANNDTKSLREVVERRLAHPEWPLPRLMVADGGKAQKSAIESVLRKYGIEIPVVAIVKDEYHRPKNMLGVTQYEKDVLLANAEAHRFAISFHRKKRDLIK